MGKQTLAEYLDSVTRKYVKATLETCNGVRIDAANRLGIKRTIQYRLIKKYGLQNNLLKAISADD